MTRILLFTLLLLSFSHPLYAHQDPESFLFSFGPTDSEEAGPIKNLEEILNQAELMASPEGRLILETGRSMVVNQEIVVGSCWDFIDAVFIRAGFPQRKRSTVFKSKYAGPYLAEDLIEPGDWLYFVNHSFGDVEHSSIFIAWINSETKEALMLSYAGGNRSNPARYKTYDLSSVYNIMRPAF